MKSLFLFLFLVSSVASAKEKNAILAYRNNKAAKKLLTIKNKDEYIGQSFDAYQTFVALTGQWPFDLTLQFNLGSTLSMNSGKDDAEKVETYFLDLIKQADQILLSEKADQDETNEANTVRLAAYYNLGVYYHMAKNVSKALEYYQKALDISTFDTHPGHLEIKTNIEMLAASGQGQGKSDQKKDDQDGQDGDQQKDSQSGEGDKKQDQKDEKDSKDQDKEKDKKDKPSNEKDNSKKKPFDQNQMSMEDLKRIMDELKQQEQAIRAKTQGKGSQNESREKDW